MCMCDYPSQNLCLLNKKMLRENSFMQATWKHSCGYRTASCYSSSISFLQLKAFIEFFRNRDFCTLKVHFYYFKFSFPFFFLPWFPALTHRWSDSPAVMANAIFQKTKWCALSGMMCWSFMTFIFLPVSLRLSTNEKILQVTWWDRKVQKCRFF